MSGNIECINMRSCVCYIDLGTLLTLIMTDIIMLCGTSNRRIDDKKITPCTIHIELVVEIIVQLNEYMHN